MKNITAIKEWFSQVVEAGDHYACCGQFIVLDPEGFPTARTVAVRAFGADSLVFFGDNRSRKSVFLGLQNGKSALVFTSLLARKQLHLTGITRIDSRSPVLDRHWKAHSRQYRLAHLGKEDLPELSDDQVAARPTSYVAFCFHVRQAEFRKFREDYQHLSFVVNY